MSGLLDYDSNDDESVFEHGLMDELGDGWVMLL